MLLRIGDTHVCESFVGAIGQPGQGALADDGHRSLCHCLGNKAVTIYVDTGDSDKEVARLHLARINDDAAYLDAAIDLIQNGR